MARIEYIGKKERKVDNVAGTGTVWNGEGDVQEVDDSAAAKLIAHKDIWRLVGGKLAAKTAKDPAAKPAKEEQEDPPIRVDVATMQRPELMQFAMRTFGKELNEKTPVAAMRKQVQKLIESDPSVKAASRK